MKYKLLQNLICNLLLLGSSFFYFSPALANHYMLPPSGDCLIGDVQYISTDSGDSPVSLAQRYNLGLNAIIDANPGTTIMTVFPSRSEVKIPSEFLLPPLPRHGIVVNLPEMRMYYYPKESNEVMTFPVGIGRIGKTIPVINTVIVRKALNPTWKPTEDIRAWNKTQGVELPDTMPPGPDNPLGPYAIYLRLPVYLIHSTIFPDSVGRRASFGCIRMNEWDIKEFFPVVSAGTPVSIIDMPNKIGWEGNSLYLEAHPPLIERKNASYATLDGAVKLIEQALPRDAVVLVDWQLVAYLLNQPDGVPHEIGIKMK